MVAVSAVFGSRDGRTCIFNPCRRAQYFSMSVQDQNQNPTWKTIHASAHNDAGGLLRPAVATPRPPGGLRCCCPVTGSIMPVTDEVTLGRFARPQARLRCAG
jgi:hypothetical protein